MPNFPKWYILIYHLKFMLAIYGRPALACANGRNVGFMVQNQHLYLKIYEDLIGDIKNGTIRDGDRLPSEMELAERFNVSRITTKKAMNMLAERGLIIRRPGLGSFVQLGDKNPEELLREDGLGRNGQNRMIGLIMEGFGGNFGPQMLSAIERRVSELGFHLCIKRSHGDQNVEEAVIDKLLDLGVEGIIIMPAHGEHYNAEILKMVVEGFPTVFLDRHLKGLPASFAGSDNVAAAEEVTRYLFDKGHATLGIISALENRAMSIPARIEGFRRAHEAIGIPFNPKNKLSSLQYTLPFHGDGTLAQEEIDKIKVFLEENQDITALFATEYGIALQIQIALEQLGKRVPEDLSVVCFDNVLPGHGMPFFTHIRQNEDLIGETAVDILSELISKNRAILPPVHRLIPAKLVEGKSVREIKAKP